jgi:GntR family transcriptional regulator
VLSLKLNVNPNTVQKAFDELDALGVIETHRGIGKFVTKGAVRNAAKRARKEVMGTFEEAIRIAKAAGLSRSEVDKVYSTAAKELGRAKKESKR